MTQANSVGDSYSPGRDVWILGAGFSRAISPYMPLTFELGQTALARLPKQDQRLITEVWGKNFDLETVMSVLAIDQPFLSISQNLRNRSIYESLTDVISEILEDAQTSVVQSLPPTWLTNFLYGCHYRRTYILTFNYDTLIESCFAHPDSPLTISSPLRGRQEMWSAIMPISPPDTPHGPTTFGSPLGSGSLSLLKLHGSLNWYRSPADVTGASLVKSPYVQPFGTSHPESADVSFREALVPGRKTYIVPPTSSKSVYYHEPLTRQIWESSKRALIEANRILVAGYSFPQTDTTTLELIRWGVSGSALKSLEIADLKPDVVKENIRASLGDELAEKVVAAREGQDAISQATDTWLKAHSIWHQCGVPQGDLHRHVMVSWGYQQASARVVGVRVEGDVATLKLSEPDAVEMYVIQDDSDAICLNDLREADGKYLAVEAAPGARQWVASISFSDQESAADQTWAVFNIAGAYPPEAPLSNREQREGEWQTILSRKLPQIP